MRTSLTISVKVWFCEIEDFENLYSLSLSLSVTVCVGPESETGQRKTVFWKYRNSSHSLSINSCNFFLNKLHSLSANNTHNNWKVHSYTPTIQNPALPSPSPSIAHTHSRHNLSVTRECHQSYTLSPNQRNLHNFPKTLWPRSHKNFNSKNTHTIHFPFHRNRERVLFFSNFEIYIVDKK